MNENEATQATIIRILTVTKLSWNYNKKDNGKLIKWQYGKFNVSLAAVTMLSLIHWN